MRWRSTHSWPTSAYPSVDDAETDYQLVKDLHTRAGMLDTYDAAVISRRERKGSPSPEAWCRLGSAVLGGGVGLATGLVVALFPFAAIGGGLLLGDNGRWGCAR